MAEVIKRLGAVEVAADTDTELYQSLGGTMTAVSCIIVCNKTSSSKTYRIAHVNASLISNVASEDYLAYDVEINGNDSTAWQIGLCMEASQCIMVRSNSATVNFIAWGSEVS